MKISIFFNNHPPLNRNIPLENFPLYVILIMYEYIFIARGRISPFTATVKKEVVLMILNFHGGVKIDAKRFFANSEIKYINNCSAVCIKAGEDHRLHAKPGQRVLCGSLLGVSEDTPVYSSVSGIFNGIMELEGAHYFVVINQGDEDVITELEPETRPILELTREDIIASARKFGIIDSRSGRPLWKLLSEAEKCTRLVVDCTDSFAHASINQRLSMEKTRSAVGGAKVMLHAIGGLKAVFAVEYTKSTAIEALENATPDKQLFAIATLEEKYPYGDIALMDAIYIKTLEPNRKPTDESVLIVGIEGAIALYDAMVSGMPQVYRYVSICDTDSKKGGNFRVPRGITYHDLYLLCGIKNDSLIIENSLLSGSPAKGALSDGVIPLISAEQNTKKRTECISCGQCASACPVRLFPAEILTGAPHLKNICISCGACEFICPAGIPLLKMIKREAKKHE